MLAFAPEWTLEPLAELGPDARVLAPLSGLAALVLLVVVVISLGGPLRATGAEAADDRAAEAGEGPARPAVQPLLGAAPSAVGWIELVELTLALALLASVLGGAATAVPGLESAAAAIAVGALLLMMAVGPWLRRVPGAVSTTMTGAAILMFALLIGTAARSFIAWTAVPVAPPPSTIPTMWAEVPFTTVLKSFGIAAATVVGMAVYARTGSRRGMGRTATVQGALLLLVILLFVSYAQRVGAGQPTIFPATREVFGGGAGATAVQAGVVWIILGAMYLTYQRRGGLEDRRRGVAITGAAVLLTLLFGADAGTLAGLWVLAALAWIVPTHALLLASRVTRSGQHRGRGSRWRAFADGLATLGTALAAIGALLFLTGCVRPVPEKRLDEVQLPAGFSIQVYVEGIEEPRQMTLGEDGTLYVGTKKLGSLYAVPDRDGDHRGDEVVVIATGLEHSNGVAVRGDTLYVSENHRITRYPGISERLHDPPEPELVTTLPRRAYHKEAYMRLGPDGALYVAVGAPCDVCLSRHPLFATLARVPLLPATAAAGPTAGDGEGVALRSVGGGHERGGSGGAGIDIVAEGIRNTVGFDWHPRTGRLWFADNGRDWLGNGVPPDELNVVSGPGLDFGFPHCHGRSIQDPEFGQGVDCSRFEPPVLELGSHVAALGVKFYDGDMFPEAYRHALFIAEHGSYNRSERVGYRLTMVAGLDGGSPEATTFADGFLTDDGTVWGRPVDLLVMPDGSLLVSDDFGNAIYRITYDSGAAP